MAIARRSVKREAMLSLLRSTDAHPGAEWVYRKLQAEFPDLSLGTVYRNLRQLEEEGLIVSVGVVDGAERFDAVTRPHAHFVCTRCGAVTDLELPDGPALRRRAQELSGGKVSGCEVRFTGLCRSCLERDMQT